MKILVFVLAMLVTGCSTLSGTTSNTLTPQGEQAILSLIQVFTGTYLGGGTLPSGQSVCQTALPLLQPSPQYTVPCVAPTDPAQFQSALQQCVINSVVLTEFMKLQARICPTTVTTK